MANSEPTKSTSASDYFSRYNPELLSLIPLDAKVVLEVGCGAGALAEAYRRRNPGVIWLGVDHDKSVTTAAVAKRIDHAWREDVENLHFPHNCELFRSWIGDRLPDVLIFGDVLEHLRNPWRVLKGFTDHALAPGGLVLASIPNVGHWTVIRGLLQGQWEYADEGLLDRDHLRFFTQASIRAMFAEAGLHVFEFRGRKLFNEGFAEWVAETLMSTPPMEIQLYQYVIRALKPHVFPAFYIPPTPDAHPSGIQGGLGASLMGASKVQSEVSRLHIHAVVHRCTENGTCCERPRIDEPLAALATIPGVKVQKTGIGWINPAEKLPDILLYQRLMIGVGNAPGTSQEFIEGQHLLSRQGCVTVAEWDDHPAAFEAQRQSDFIALRGVHAVQVSTEPLAEIVRKWNPNVAVFPNQLMELPPWEDKPQNEAVRIFFGALNRQRDWEPIMPALRQIGQEFDGKVKFVVVHDKAFFDALMGCDASFSEFLPYPEYLALLRSCDIALLPLNPNEFNTCKSDIKFLECAACGVTVLASNTGELYAKVIRLKAELTPGMLWHETAPFEMQLGKLIENTNIRYMIAKNAYNYVRDHRLLGQHYRARFAWYQGLLMNRERLHRELLERVPELKGGK